MSPCKDFPRLLPSIINMTTRAQNPPSAKESSTLLAPWVLDFQGDISNPICLKVDLKIDSYCDQSCVCFLVLAKFPFYQVATVYRLPAVLLNPFEMFQDSGPIWYTCIPQLWYSSLWSSVLDSVGRRANANGFLDQVSMKTMLGLGTE
jgi:hypothetical protein